VWTFCGQGGGVCPVWTFCGQGGFQMRTSALFGAKNFGVVDIYGVSARTGGLSQCSPVVKKRNLNIRDKFGFSY